MVEGRSEQVFKTWLTERLQTWRDALEVVAMDGFTGFETATTEELPEAVAVMDPFHVVRLAADALDQCRRRVQQDTCRHRGRTGDPLYSSRRTLHTGAGLLTDSRRAGSWRCSRSERTSTLGRTLHRRAAKVLAYVDRPGTSNGPTEATNGRLEHLRGSALGFRNLTNYIVRSLLETGGFRPRLHPRL